MKIKSLIHTVQALVIAWGMQTAVVAETASFVQVGERQPPQEEKMIEQEKRAQLEVEEQETNQEEAPANHLPSREAVKKLNALQDKMRGLKGTTRTVYKVEVALPSDYFLYSGYQHFATLFSDNGKVVQLEDESQWEVNYFDRYDILNWLTGDRLVIYPNHEWFMKYDYNYCLVNCQTGASVRTKMTRSPLIYGPHSKQVQGIDAYNGRVYLSDGTVWEIKGSDINLLYNWLQNDLVVIGCNDGWWSRGTWPAILINVNLDQYVYARLQIIN